MAVPSEALGEGVETQQEIQEQALDLSRQSMHRSVDAAGRVTADTQQLAELREVIDDSFDGLLEQQSEAVEAIGSEAVEAIESEAVEPDALTEEVVENLGDQIDLLVEVNERLEAQLREAVEQRSGEVGDADEIAAELEGQLEELSAQFERQVERLADLEAEFDADTDA